VIRIGVLQDELRLRQRAAGLDDGADVHPLPRVVQARPARDAVNVGRQRDARQPQELLPRPRHGVGDEAEAAERPALRIEARRQSIGEHRPLLRQHLAGRHTRRQGGIDRSLHASSSSSGLTINLRGGLEPRSYNGGTRAPCREHGGRGGGLNGERKLAMFMDFENIARGVKEAQYKQFELKLVLERLLEKGKIIVRRAYADWNRFTE